MESSKYEIVPKKLKRAIVRLLGHDEFQMMSDCVVFLCVLLLEFVL